MDGLASSQINPMDQFDIKGLLHIYLSFFFKFYFFFTNIGLYLTIGALISLIFNILALKYNIIFSTSWLISLESIYATIHSVVISQIGQNK